MRIVGGPFDGAEVPGFMSGSMAPVPPEKIMVGQCPPGNDCGSKSCRKGRSDHISWWEPREGRHPDAAAAYVKESESVSRFEGFGKVELRGLVVYAIGGLTEPKNFGEKAREPITA
jgi:hypothetical protein